MKNMINLKEFKSKKEGSSLQESIVTKVGDNYMVQGSFPVPQSLVNAFVKKVKDASDQNIKETLGDQMIADQIATYVMNSFLNIENLPVNLAIGDNFTAASTQPEMQSQTQGQTQELQPEVQETETDLTAQEIPAQEGGQVQGTQTQAGVQTIQAQ